MLWSLHTTDVVPPSSSVVLWYAQIFLLLCELEAFIELLKALQAM